MISAHEQVMLIAVTKKEKKNSGAISAAALEWKRSWNAPFHGVFLLLLPTMLGGVRVSAGHSQPIFF